MERTDPQSQANGNTPQAMPANKQAHTRAISSHQFNVLGLLCGTLQHLESLGSSIDPKQFKLVVTRLTDMLATVNVDDDVRGLLALYPAAAELYENLQYSRDGLCLHAPEVAAQTERAAQQVIATVRSAVR
ncbi:MAG: hypothetical protein WA888_10685 [Burkholderiaceae bacterium]